MSLADIYAQHTPVIGVRAAWYSELAAQAANYYPAGIGPTLWSAAPTKQTLDTWHHARKGILVVGQNAIANLAVIYRGTQWLTANQPVSWKVDNASFCTLYTDAAFGKTTLYPDKQMVAVFAPNPAQPDPNVPAIKGSVGRAVLITGTFSDGSTITEEVIMFPQQLADPLAS
jgi:hypothetical protein